MIKILALDGGGIHGLISAYILREIEQNLPNPDAVDLDDQNILKDYFDIIAGTSTGSILAAGICLGLPLSRIIELYEDRGKVIFKPWPSRWGSRMTRAFKQGISHPKHDDKGLKSELKKVFGDKKLGDVQERLLIQVFDATKHEPVIFKSLDPDHPDDKNLLLWEIVKSSCSAPTFFPAHSLKYRGGKASAMIDGGVFANNPTLCALAEMYSKNLNVSKNILAVSVGTSEERAEGISVRDGRQRGAMEWALPLIGIFMGGASRHVHSLSRRIIEDSNPENCYLRFQPETEDDIPIDEADPEDIRRIQSVAFKYLDGSLGFEGDFEAKLEKLKAVI